MALEDNGFEIKRYDEIIKQINEEFSSNAGIDIDTSSDSIANIMNSLSARQLALLWELGQSINDSTDITKAEGAALDNLGLYVGLIREPDKQSYGIAWFTGDNGITISTNAVVSTARGDEFQPTYDVTISPTNCLSTTLELNTILDSTEYQVSVNGTQYNYTSGIGATEESIIIGINDALGAGSSEFTTSIVDNTSIYLVTEDLDSGNTLNIIATTYLNFSGITTPSLVESVEYGFIEGSAHSLKFIDTPLNGWDSVDNPSDMTLGRFEQDDDEFRTSILNNYDVKDSGTYQGIKDAVESVAGVSSVDLFENQEFYTQTFNSVDVTGKSFMVTVDGGVDQDIAQTIFETKPAGIKTSGSEDILITDEDGQPHIISFSRSERLFFYMKISGTTFSEEIYPSDGNERIKQACLLYGDSLGIGDDVIPQRFVGVIYDEVDGLDSITVEIAYNTSPSLPIDDPLLVYTTSRIPVSTTEVPLFATDRMEVTIA